MSKELACHIIQSALLSDLMYNVHPALQRVPFGGKVVVCTGDYHQIISVVKNENQSATVCASLCSSYLWRHVRVLELVENMRIKAARLAGAPNHVLENLLPPFTVYKESSLLRFEISMAG